MGKTFGMIKKGFGLAALYMAMALSANGGTFDHAAALAEGDMKKLTFHSDPAPAPSTAFQTFEGETMSLEDYRGDWVVLNFWATWCAPCRKEMPMLSNLATEFEGKGLQVVTVATGRNPPAAMARFFDEIGVENLPLHRDPKQKLARDMAVLGLPITVVLDPAGNEVARLRGDAHWDSDSAVAILNALIEGPAS